MLGVNTTYSDINHASVLVEIAREEAGHVPDVSFVPHFFLDLVESQIIYLPVYPDDSGTDFNFTFFGEAPNSLHRFVPGAEKFDELSKVIDVLRLREGVMHGWWRMGVRARPSVFCTRPRRFGVQGAPDETS